MVQIQCFFRVAWEVGPSRRKWECEPGRILDLTMKDSDANCPGAWGSVSLSIRRHCEECLMLTPSWEHNGENVIIENIIVTEKCFGVPMRTFLLTVCKIWADQLPYTSVLKKEYECVCHCQGLVSSMTVPSRAPSPASHGLWPGTPAWKGLFFSLQFLFLHILCIVPLDVKFASRVLYCFYTSPILMHHVPLL